MSEEFSNSWEKHNYLPPLEPFRDRQGNVIGIDQYLLSPSGRQEMNRFISRLDDSQDLAKTVAYMVGEALEDPDQTVALLLSNDGKQGLSREELTDAYRRNPAINRTIDCINIAHHHGAKDMKRLYGDLLAVLTNVSRYEALCGVHDPDSEAWQSRALAVRYHKGGEFTQYLPQRYEPPS